MCRQVWMVREEVHAFGVDVSSGVQQLSVLEGVRRAVLAWLTAAPLTPVACRGSIGGRVLGSGEGVCLPRSRLGRWRYGALAASAALMLLGVLACSQSQTDLEDLLYARKAERTELLDQMYSEYVESAGSVKLPGLLRTAGEEARRQWFELQIRTVGNGERPKLLPAGSVEFFERMEVRKRSRRVVELDREIEATQERLEVLEQR